MNRISTYINIAIILVILSSTAQAEITFPAGSVTYPASSFSIAVPAFVKLIPDPTALNSQAARLDPNGSWGIQYGINGSLLKKGYEYKLYTVARVKFNAKPTGSTFGIGLYDYIAGRAVYNARMWTAEESSADWKAYDTGSWIPAPYEQTLWVNITPDASEYIDFDRFVVVPQSFKPLDTVCYYLSNNPNELASVARGGRYGYSSIELADARSLKIQTLVGGDFDPNLYPDSWAGLVVDYHTSAGYSHRVNYTWGSSWRGTPDLEGDAAKSTPSNVQTTLGVQSRTPDTFIPFDIAAKAPKDWDGKVKIGSLVRGLYNDKALLAVIFPGSPLSKLPYLGCTHGDSPDYTNDFGGILGPDDTTLAKAINSQYRTMLEKRVANGSALPPFILRTESPQYFVFKDRINPQWADSSLKAQPIDLKLAKQEYESAQVAIIPSGTNSLSKVTVTCSDLIGPKGKITTGDIKLWRVDYVENNRPALGQSPDWWPDPLLPNASFEIPAGQNRAVWFTVHTTANTPAGVYRGKLTVKSANAPTVQVPVTVTVWDFTVAKTGHLKMAFWFFFGQAETIYNMPNGLPMSLQYKFADFLNEYKIGMSFPGAGPDHIDSYNRGFKQYREADGSFTYDFSDVDKLLKRCIADGQNSFNIALACCGNSPWDLIKIRDRKTGEDYVYKFQGYQDPGFWTMYESFLKAITKHMKDKGWWKYCYFQGNDEPGEGRPGSYEDTAKLYDFVHKVIPDMKCLITKQPVPQLDGHVDIWCPLDHYFDPVVSKQQQAAGKTMWWYIIGRFNHSVPAMDIRMTFWTTWKYNLSGLLYWGSNYWCSPSPEGKTNIQKDPVKRWPNSPWILSQEYSGQICYPGPDGPLPCQRLESVRDGIEDYEYLYLLSTKLAKLRKQGKTPSWAAEADNLLAVPGNLVTDKDKNTRDYAQVQLTREKIAKMILSKK